jgi:hypothetical protein
MTNHPLSALPQQLESISNTLSERLFTQYGEKVGQVLVQVGVVHPKAGRCFAEVPGPVEQQLDRFVALALYCDCLTLIMLACLLGRPPLDWARLEGIRLLLTRIASFYAATQPGYREFRTLQREGLTDFFNRFATGPEPFSLLNEATRFQGVRLCAHVSRVADAGLLRRYLDDVLHPLWQYCQARASVDDAVAAQIHSDLNHTAGRP